MYYQAIGQQSLQVRTITTTHTSLQHLEQQAQQSNNTLHIYPRSSFLKLIGLLTPEGRATIIGTHKLELQVFNLPFCSTQSKVYKFLNYKLLNLQEPLKKKNMRSSKDFPPFKSQSFQVHPTHSLFCPTSSILSYTF
jgi:hypothetical protein